LTGISDGTRRHTEYMSTESAREGQALAQIGEVADSLGLSLRTLRHWEEVGLVIPSARSEGGFRLYSTDDIRRIETVMRMKPLGLNLREVRRLLELVEAAGSEGGLSDNELAARSDELGDFLRRCEEAVEKLRRRLREGRELRVQLTHLLAECDLERRRRGGAGAPAGSEERVLSTPET
jgi:DNA-binding transcriptional MerR regulator